MPSIHQQPDTSLSNYRRRILAGAATSLALTLPAAAQTQPTGAFERLPEITVSAHQVPLTQAQSGTSVTVISGQELREKNLQTVADALRAVPGVQVESNGGRGSTTFVRIRGAETRHTLVLIDGVEVNQTGFVGFDFADLATDDIEKLEVLRGPQSGIYGANAQAGVISIITRSGKGLAKPQADLRVEGGSFSSGTFAAGVRGAMGPAYGALSVSTNNTSGYNISRTGNERDGSNALTVSGKGGIDFTPQFGLDHAFRYTGRKTDTDQGFDFVTGLQTDDSSSFRYNSNSGRVGATFSALDGRWIHNANVRLFNEASRNFNSAGLQDFGGNGERISTDYKSTLFGESNVAGGEKHTTAFFLDRRTERFDQFANLQRYQKERRSIGGEYILDLLAPGSTISAAVRQDWNTMFTDNLTYRLAWSQRLPVPGARLHMSQGSGVTDPDIFQLFGAGGFFGNLPNPSLRPERSVGFDAGIEQRFWGNRALVDVTYFNTDYTDKFERTPTFPAIIVNGTGVAKRRGMEVTNVVEWLPWLSTTAIYTYTDADDSNTEREIRRAPHTGSFEVTTRWFDNRTRASMRVAYTGTRDDFSFATFPSTRVTLPATAIVRASISHDVTPWATAYLRAENVFDHRYEDILGFRSSPFTLFGGLKLRTVE